MPDQQPDVTTPPSQGADYDPELFGDVLNEQSWNATPDHAKQRYAKLGSKLRNAEQDRQRALERADALERRFAELEQKVSANQRPAEPTAEGIEALSDTDAKKAIREIRKAQQAAVDPDRSDEERAAARQRLAALDDPDTMVVDLTTMLAERKAGKTVEAFRSERDAAESEQQQQQRVVQTLIGRYGQDAMNPKSELAQAALGLLKDWTTEYGLTGSDINGAWTLKAFAEAAQQVKQGNRGGRVSDPRHLAVNGPGVRDSVGFDEIAALEKKAKQGDWKAKRKVMSAKMAQFYKANYGRE